MTRDFTSTPLNYPTNADTPIKRVMVNRPPKTGTIDSDYKNFTPGDEWLDTSNYEWWKFVRVSGAPPIGIWILLGSGNLEFLTGNVGGPVAADPGNNINIVGTGSTVVTGTPGTNTLTISTTGLGSLTGDSGGAVPPDGSNNINILGNGPVQVDGFPGLNKLTITVDNATTLASGIVQLATNAETIAGTDTTKATTPDDIKAKLGTQTLHGLPIGEGTAAAFNWTAAPTDGQLLVGSTGNDPVLANLTAGTGVTITNGPGTISIAAVGKVIQQVFTSNNVSSSTATVIPSDNTIPQQTEGFQILSATITPTNAANLLFFEIQIFFGATAVSTMTTALFKDANLDAIACQGQSMPGITFVGTTNLIHRQVAGAAVAQTYKVRVGSNSGTTYTFNGGLGIGALYGGVANCNMTIWEIEP